MATTVSCAAKATCAYLSERTQAFNLPALVADAKDEIQALCGNVNTQNMKIIEVRKSLETQKIMLVRELNEAPSYVNKESLEPLLKFVERRLEDAWDSRNVFYYLQEWVSAAILHMLDAAKTRTEVNDAKTVGSALLMIMENTAKEKVRHLETMENLLRNNKQLEVLIMGLRDEQIRTSSKCRRWIDDACVKLANILDKNEWIEPVFQSIVTSLVMLAGAVVGGILGGPVGAIVGGSLGLVTLPATNWVFNKIRTTSLAARSKNIAEHDEFVMAELRLLKKRLGTFVKDTQTVAELKDAFTQMQKLFTDLKKTVEEENSTIEKQVLYDAEGNIHICSICIQPLHKGETITAPDTAWCVDHGHYFHRKCIMSNSEATGRRECCLCKTPYNQPKDLTQDEIAAAGYVFRVMDASDQ